MLLFFALHLPEHVVGRNRCSKQGYGATDANKTEIQVGYKSIDKDFSPVWMGVKRRYKVANKGQTHDDEDFFDRLKIAVDRQVPKRYRNWYHKPYP